MSWIGWGAHRKLSGRFRNTHPRIARSASPGPITQDGCCLGANLQTLVFIGPGLGLRPIRGWVTPRSIPHEIRVNPWRASIQKKSIRPHSRRAHTPLMRTERLRTQQPILRAFAALLHRWLGFVLFCLRKRDELPDCHALNFYEHELKRAIFARAFATAPKINFRAQATRGHRWRAQSQNWLMVITRGLLPKLQRRTRVARMARIDHVRAHIDRYVNKLLARLARGLLCLRVTHYVTHVRVCVSDAEPCAVACADTS